MLSDIDSHTSVLVDESRIFIFGGFINQSQLSNEMFIYDYEENLMRKLECKGKKPCARSAHSTVFDNDIHLYIFGGIKDSLVDRLNDLWVFNIVSHTYSEVVPMDRAEIP